MHTKRITSLARLLLLPALLVSAAGRAQAPAGDPPAPAPTPTPWYQEIAVNGLVSTSYSYNVNRPASGTNGYRVFDFDDSSIKLDVAELVVQKVATKPGEIGFRVDAVAGGSIPRLSAASGLFRDVATGKAQDFDLQQAFVSWIAPLGNGLRLDVGKYVTSHGYELIEGYDGYNDNATRSILFGYAIPFTHTGLKATYSFADAVSANFQIVNGWDDVKDNNSSKTLGVGLTVAPSPKVTFIANYMYGPEQTGNDHDARGLLDLVVTLKPTDTVTVGANLDWATESGAAAGGGSAVWWGVAGYLRLNLSPTFALALRGELFDDRDGVRTGTIQKLKEVTLTPEVKIGAHVVLRGDVRVDFSDREVFEDRDGAFTKKSQPTFLLNALYTF